MVGRFVDPMFTILIIRYLSSPFFQTGFYSFSLHSCTCILAMGIGIITVVSFDCVGIGGYDFSDCFGLCLALMAVVVMVAVVL